MDSLTVVTATVLVLMIFLTIVVLVDLAFLPGRIAARRGHPHADAVRITGAVGLLAGGLFWLGALAWAFFDYRKFDEMTGRHIGADMSKRLDELEQRLAQVLKHNKEKGQ